MPYLVVMLERALAGLIAAAAIAALAWRAGSLSRSGALAATAIGVASVAAGWHWGAVLIAYFLSSSLLSRLGEAEKTRRTQSIVEKGGERDATQVFANGGVFAACALTSQFSPPSLAIPLTAAALGALAASAADTWGTEVGTLYGGTPRLLFGFEPVPAGTSGAVSAAGSLAMVAGAFFVALTAQYLGVPAHVGAVAAAGIVGALTDSLLGATHQERRWCATCTCASERRTHDCGTSTSLTGGREWMGNDVVNMLATLTGGAVAVLLTL